MIKVTFYKWKIDKESKKLIKKMTLALQKLLKNQSLSINIIDVASYGEIKHETGYGLAFGKARRYLSGENIFKLPPTKDLDAKSENIAARKKAFETLKNVAELINKASTKEEVPEENIEAVVVRENTSIGNSKKADIIIPEDTIDYLRKVRDLLGGGRIEITKGDLHLVIEE